jgi:hypothetical protein
MTTPKLVRVFYWVGTTQHEALAADYAEAMAIASRNQNKYDPTFYEIATGERLYDDGNGLCVEDHSYYVV